MLAHVAIGAAVKGDDMSCRMAKAALTFMMNYLY